MSLQVNSWLYKVQTEIPTAKLNLDRQNLRLHKAGKRVHNHCIAQVKHTKTFHHHHQAPKKGRQQGSTT